MKKFAFLIISVVVLLASCKDESTIDLEMSDDTLVALIQDLHVANAIVLKYKNEDKDSVGQLLRDEMAKIHNISEERIDYVMEQLQRSPKKYLELEKKAVENLKILKDSLKTKPIQNQSKADNKKDDKNTQAKKR